MTYKVTSLVELDREDLLKLRGLGFLGYGQEFYIRSQESGEDEVETSEVDRYTGKIIATPGINPYSKQPYTPRKIPYYVYVVESIVDSSD